MWIGSSLAPSVGVETIGLCRGGVQSSGSGGVHVYFFLAEEVHTLPWHARCAPRCGMPALPCRQGGAVLNRKSHDSWFKPHRLPMQEGLNSSRCHDGAAADLDAPFWLLQTGVLRAKIFSGSTGAMRKVKSSANRRSYIALRLPTAGELT